MPLEAGPGAPTGLWVRLPSVDAVFVQANTSPAHRTLIRLHELSHIAAGHDCRVNPDLMDMLFPGLEPELVHSVLLTRDGYDRVQEQEAEMLALLLADHLGTNGGTTYEGRRLTETLSYPVRSRGWRRAN
ncbi:hypothetical protein [Kitasatospora sp. NPDC088548]|uniref:hypothetical protein n=1 Tax=Kitasatospora sp. NPDC088548 TaxID=3364075 RepID=UPI003802D616